MPLFAMAGTYAQPSKRDEVLAWLLDAVGALGVALEEFEILVTAGSWPESLDRFVAASGASPNG